MSKQYSLDYLKSISGGDEDFIKDMIQTFVSSVPEELKKIEGAIKQSDWMKAGEFAHKFGSNLMYLELEELKKIVGNIETYGLGMKHTNEIPLLFEKLSAGCFQIIELLKKDFDYLKR
jgi:HPt (histidine-containing phosphotransfer) domain-containing protein